jgi:hypothetical protein
MARTREIRAKRIIRETIETPDQPEIVEATIQEQEIGPNNVLRDLIISSVVQASVALVSNLPNRHLGSQDQVLESHIRSHLKLAKTYFKLAQTELKDLFE